MSKLSSLQLSSAAASAATSFSNNLLNINNVNNNNNSVNKVNITQDKCTYCQNSLGTISIKCSECFNFFLCLKVT